jgi:hypothetical protein
VNDKILCSAARCGIETAVQCSNKLGNVCVVTSDIFNPTRFSLPCWSGLFPIFRSDVLPASSGFKCVAAKTRGGVGRAGGTPC